MIGASQGLGPLGCVYRALFNLQAQGARYRQRSSVSSVGSACARSPPCAGCGAANARASWLWRPCHLLLLCRQGLQSRSLGRWVSVRRQLLRSRSVVCWAPLCGRVVRFRSLVPVWSAVSELLSAQVPRPPFRARYPPPLPPAPKACVVLLFSAADESR